MLECLKSNFVFFHDNETPSRFMNSRIRKSCNNFSSYYSSIFLQSMPLFCSHPSSLPKLDTSLTSKLSERNHYIYIYIYNS